MERSAENGIQVSNFRCAAKVESNLHQCKKYAVVCECTQGVQCRSQLFMNYECDICRNYPSFQCNDEEIMLHAFYSHF